MLYLSAASLRTQSCLRLRTLHSLQLRNKSQLSAIKRGIREESPARDDRSRRTPYRSQDDRSGNSQGSSRPGAARFAGREERSGGRNDRDRNTGRGPRSYDDKFTSRPARNDRFEDNSSIVKRPNTEKYTRDTTRAPQKSWDRSDDNKPSSRPPRNGRFEDHSGTAERSSTERYTKDVTRTPQKSWAQRPDTDRGDGNKPSSRTPRSGRYDDNSSMFDRSNTYKDRSETGRAPQKTWAQPVDMDQGYEDGSTTSSKPRTQRFTIEQKPGNLTYDSWRKEDRGAPESSSDLWQKPAQRGSAAMEDISVPYSHAAAEFLYGQNVVYAALKSGKRTLYKLYLHDRAAENASKGHDLERLAKSVGVTVKRVRNDFLSTMDKMADGRPHNGVILEASALPLPPVACLERIDMTKREMPLTLSPQTAEERALHGNAHSLHYAASPWRNPLVLLLDGIVDPGNVGNIIRTAYFYGVDAIAICTNTCASVSLNSLIKAASGASEAIPILAIQKPADFVSRSSANGWRICAAVAPQSSNPRDRDFHPKKQSHKIPTQTQLHTHRMTTPLARGPALLMIGAEGEGLRENLRSKARYNIAIETVKRERADDIGVDSLNVGAATAVLIEAFMRRPQMNFTDRTSNESGKPVSSASAGNTIIEGDDGQDIEENEPPTKSVADLLMSMPDNEEQIPPVLVPSNNPDGEIQPSHMPSPALVNDSEPSIREPLRDDEIASLADLENKFRKMTQEAAAMETSESTSQPEEVTPSTTDKSLDEVPKSIQVILQREGAATPLEDGIDHRIRTKRNKKPWQSTRAQADEEGTEVIVSDDDELSNPIARHPLGVTGLPWSLQKERSYQRFVGHVVKVRRKKQKKTMMGCLQNSDIWYSYPTALTEYLRRYPKLKHYERYLLLDYNWTLREFNGREGTPDNKRKGKKTNNVRSNGASELNAKEPERTNPSNKNSGEKAVCEETMDTKRSDVHAKKTGDLNKEETENIMSRLSREQLRGFDSRVSVVESSSSAPKTKSQPQKASGFEEYILPRSSRHAKAAERSRAEQLPDTREYQKEPPNDLSWLLAFLGFKTNSSGEATPVDRRTTEKSKAVNVKRKNQKEVSDPAFDQRAKHTTTMNTPNEHDMTDTDNPSNNHKQPSVFLAAFYHEDK